MFEFAYEMPGLGGALLALHTGDMPFIWRTYNEPDLPGWPTLAGADFNAVAAISQDFGGLYASFIRTGNPGPRWKPFGEQQNVFWFGESVQTRENLLTAERAVFEHVGGIESVQSLEQLLVRNVREELAARLETA